MAMAARKQDEGQDAGLRAIGGADWERMRWGWLEAVRRAADLNATARLMAHVLALDYANRTTARCDPSMRELAAAVGVSEDTVKRAITALIDGAWIARDRGLGRGHKSGYAFLTRAKIVAIKGGNFAPIKGGSPAPFYGHSGDSEKGANLRGKGGKSAPRHNIAKPCKNHKARASALAPSKNPMVRQDAERAVRSLREGRANALDDLPFFTLNHIIAADLLTPQERQAAGLCQEDEGQTDEQ